MQHDVTQLLIDWNNGDPAALDRLMPAVYDELHRRAQRFMARERRGHTLQPTALVHEAFLHLIDQNRVTWANRAHFFGVASQLMRRITMLHVRHLRAAKRGGGVRDVVFDEALDVPVQRTEELIALDDALATLATLEPRLTQVVEMRFFGGMTVEETAEAINLSPSTVKREWRAARAWLLDHLRTPTSS